MELQEVNRIIAEYMGWKECGCDIKLVPTPFQDECEECGLEFKWNEHLSARYHRSLDALVPVWEKLKYVNYFEFNLHQTWFSLSISEKKGEWTEESWGKETIQEAAAFATAKAIQSLEKK